MQRAIIYLAVLAAMSCSRDDVEGLDGATLDASIDAGAALDAAADAARPVDSSSGLDGAADAAKVDAAKVDAMAARDAVVDAAPPPRLDGSPPGCMPSPEVCDGVDNDCNGPIDDNVTDDEGPCRVGTGACTRDGQERCVQGALRCDVLAGDAAAERCDSVDNDCDGRVDEESCRGGQFCDGNDCVAECDVRPEECDGADNDCDGRFDEDLSQICGMNTGACRRGTETCRDGRWENCDAVEAEAEMCDGDDNDCDGRTDEDSCARGEVCEDGDCVNVQPPCSTVYQFNGNARGDDHTVCYNGARNDFGKGILELCLEMERVGDGPQFRARICKGGADDLFSSDVAMEIRGTNPDYGHRRLYYTAREDLDGARCSDWHALDVDYIEGAGGDSDSLVGTVVSPHTALERGSAPIAEVEGRGLHFETGWLGISRVCE